MATRRVLSWLPVGWSVVAVLCLWLTIATVLDPDGPWWVPLTFAGCTVVAAGSVVAWLLERRRRNRP
ncbi:hypothetical protein ACQEUX_22055 [Micromonospora sp. CA-259024]|uniref:hypothetical protein n=1 Tax=Micromonospora sp. CA-259024 TaxID=3239965 RepID=UPI003D8C99F8